jgi:hypothetical protein
MHNQQLLSQNTWKELITNGYNFDREIDILPGQLWEKSINRPT